jgi:prophage regulatory protein
VVKLIGRPELRARGITWSRQHIDRLEKAGRFPRHVDIGENSIAWVEAEIDAWLEARIAERDAAAPRQTGPAPEAPAP